MKNFDLNKAFLTFFGVGLLRPAPGTWGSLTGLIIGVLVVKYLSLTTLFLMAILVAIISINSVNLYEKNGGIHDNSSIVIDEVVGIWITLSMALAIPAGGNFSFEELKMASRVENLSYLGVILSFIFFRFFDITKPSVIGKIDRGVKGGAGVVLDDALAGFFAGLLSLMVLGFMIKFGFAEYIF